MTWSKQYVFLFKLKSVALLFALHVVSQLDIDHLHVVHFVLDIFQTYLQSWSKYFKTLQCFSTDAINHK